jgi:hypothetical protein
VKSRTWTVILYVLAVLIVLGRIGNALDDPHGFWAGIVDLAPPFSAELIGRDVASLGMDLIVFVASRDILLQIRGRKRDWHPIQRVSVTNPHSMDTICELC